MKKIPLFGYVLITGYILLFVANGIFFNVAKNNLAEKYYKQSLDNTDVTLLIKSAILSPSDTKTLEIVSEYYRTGQPKKAESWIKGLSRSQRNDFLAQHYLCLGESTKFLNVVSKTASPEELEIIAEILNDFNKIDNLKEPKTDLGILLQAINKRNYKVEGVTYLNVLLKNSLSEKRTNTELQYANKLIEAGQSGLAEFILQRLIQEEAEISKIYVLMAASYDKKGDYLTALEYQKKAIQIDPGADYYEKGIEYAQKSGKESDTKLLTETARRLKEIKE